MKPKRIENRQLIDEIKEEPCLICSKTPVDAHHLTSVGAGGDDTEDNLAPLCRKHHSEFHQYGLSKFCWKYPKIREFLTKHKRLDLLDKIHHYAPKQKKAKND